MPRRKDALRADRRVGVLSDLDLAAIHDVWPSTVRRVRMQLGKPAPIRRVIDWTGCDLTRPTAVICAEKGCVPSAVSEARKRFGVSEYQRTSTAANRRPLPGRQVDESIAAAAAYAKRLHAQGLTKKAAARKAAGDFCVNWRSVETHFRNRHKTRAALGGET